MKKIIALLLVLILALSLCLFTGCNQQVFDTTYSFEEAYVFGPNGAGAGARHCVLVERLR